MPQSGGNELIEIVEAEQYETQTEQWTFPLLGTPNLASESKKNGWKNVSQQNAKKKKQDNMPQHKLLRCRSVNEQFEPNISGSQKRWNFSWKNKRSEKVRESEHQNGNKRSKTSGPKLRAGRNVGAFRPLNCPGSRRSKTRRSGGRRGCHPAPTVKPPRRSFPAIL